MHFRTGARGHPSPQYLWIKALRDTRDTSDHKCILIRNPAYKYKHYKFLKSEGLVGAIPVQRLPQKLHDRSPFKPAVHSL